MDRLATRVGCPDPAETSCQANQPHFVSFLRLGSSHCLVYGLSGDSPTSQANWKTKHSFPYSLLCDPGQILLSLLGAVKGPKSNQRSHYIVEKGGKIVDAKYTVSPKDSTRLALEFIKGQAGPDGEKKD